MARRLMLMNEQCCPSHPPQWKARCGSCRQSNGSTLSVGSDASSGRTMSSPACRSTTASRSSREKPWCSSRCRFKSRRPYWCCLQTTTLTLGMYSNWWIALSVAWSAISNGTVLSLRRLDVDSASGSRTQVFTSPCVFTLALSRDADASSSLQRDELCAYRAVMQPPHTVKCDTTYL
jgi:hypothetical protein